MDSPAPPTYQEATREIPPCSPAIPVLPNTVSPPENFCHHCRASISGGNYCEFCGRALNEASKPADSTPRFGANKLPPITTVKQAETPRPASPDKNHKYDMALRIGDRLVYDFEKVACCPGQVVGLDPHVEDALPWELEQEGITREQWRTWMKALMKNQRRAPSIAGCLCMFCIPGLWAQSILCALFCPISMDHCLKCLPCCYGDWYAGLREWQADVNAVLNHHNMHVKLMTYKPWQQAPKSMLHGNRIAGKDHNYEMSMMVIALTEEETHKLKMESWDHGVNDGCTSGIGRIL